MYTMVLNVHVVKMEYIINGYVWYVTKDQSLNFEIRYKYDTNKTTFISCSYVKNIEKIKCEY